jgi:hypothetical protein
MTKRLVHGDVTRALRKLLPITGYIQIAGVPARRRRRRARRPYCRWKSDASAFQRAGLRQ